MVSESPEVSAQQDGVQVLPGNLGFGRWQLEPASTIRVSACQFTHNGCIKPPGDQADQRWSGSMAPAPPTPTSGRRRGPVHQHRSSTSRPASRCGSCASVVPPTPAGLASRQVVSGCRLFIGIRITLTCFVEHLERLDASARALRRRTPPLSACCARGAQSALPHR